jgi:mRNA interferase RelE/StbE
MNLKRDWALKTDNIVWKDLRRMPRDDVRSILIAMDQLIVDPFAGDIKKIQGEEDAWRRRVGSYRIFYRILPDLGIIWVFRVERRSSNTY